MATSRATDRPSKHDFIGTEHLLLGLLGEPQGLAYEVLVAKTESEQRIRDAIKEAIPPAGQKALRGHIPFRPERQGGHRAGTPRVGRPRP